jgi:hypothetical protein
MFLLHQNLTCCGCSGSFNALLSVHQRSARHADPPAAAAHLASVAETREAMRAAGVAGDRVTYGPRAPPRGPHAPVPIGPRRARGAARGEAPGCRAQIRHRDRGNRAARRVEPRAPDAPRDAGQRSFSAPTSSPRGGGGGGGGGRGVPTGPRSVPNVQLSGAGIEPDRSTYNIALDAVWDKDAREARAPRAPRNAPGARSARAHVLMRRCSLGGRCRRRRCTRRRTASTSRWCKRQSYPRRRLIPD